jgi:hypothetical protein
MLSWSLVAVIRIFVALELGCGNKNLLSKNCLAFFSAVKTENPYSIL